MWFVSLKPQSNYLPLKKLLNTRQSSPAIFAKQLGPKCIQSQEFPFQKFHNKFRLAEKKNKTRATF